MNVWYSLRQLVGLPDMPNSVARMRDRAQRENWTSRPRQGKGGGLEYHFDTLPPETQQHLRAQQAQALTSEAAAAGRQAARRIKLAETIDAAAAERQRQTALARIAPMTGRARERLEQRLDLLTQLDQHLTAGGDLETWAKTQGVGVSTIYKWRKVAAAQPDALAGRYGNRAGTGKIDAQPEVRELVLAMLTDHPHISPRHLRMTILSKFRGRADVQIPSSRAVQRWVHHWRQHNPALAAAITNPDRYKSAFMPAFGSASEAITRLNQQWEMDATLADLRLADGRRYAILFTIDVWSRRVAIYVSRTSSAAAVAHLTRRCILDWGMPEVVKTDNGSDYASAQMQRIFRMLGVKQDFCAPFSPWMKPHIERVIQTYLHDLVELLPGFVGHNVAETQAIRERAQFSERLFKKDALVEVGLSRDELQDFSDRWVRTIYEHQPHSGLDGRTPLQQYASWTGETRTVADPRALDVLLAPAPGGDNGYRTVTKKGIRIEGYTYIAPELPVGQRVLVLCDPEDMGRVRCFGGPDGQQYLCTAECPELTGINRQEVAAKARATQTAAVQAAKRELKAAARKINTREAVEAILDDRDAATRNVVALPKPQTEHTSAGIAAAAAVVAEIDDAAKPKAVVVSVEEMAQLRREVEAEQRAPVAPLFENEYQRAYWLSLQEQDRPLTPLEQEDLRRFRAANPRQARDLDEGIAARTGSKGMDLANKKPRRGKRQG